MESTKPLFVETYDALLLALRLDGAVNDQGASVRPLIDQALAESRAEIYSKLSIEDTTTLAAIPYDPNPTTNDGVRRQMARTVEIKLVRYFAMPSMRVFFGSAISAVKDSYNSEWLLSQDSDESERYRKQLKNESDQILDFLIPSKDIDQAFDESSRFATIGPADQTRVPRPGGTVYKNPITLQDILTKQE